MPIFMARKVPKNQTAAHYKGRQDRHSEPRISKGHWRKASIQLVLPIENLVVMLKMGGYRSILVVDGRKGRINGAIWKRMVDLHTPKTLSPTDPVLQSVYLGSLRIEEVSI